MINHKRFKFAAIFLAGLLAMLACGASPPPTTGGGSGNPTKAPGSGPSINIPGNIPEGDKTDLLKQTVYFAPMGGGGIYACSFDDSGDDFFEFDIFGNNSHENARLCFKDVIGSNAEVALYFPDGSLAAGAAPVMLVESDSSIDNGIPDLMVDVWFPATMPDGTWRAVLTTDSEQRELEFMVEEPNVSVVTQADGEVISPLINQQWDSSAILSTGDALLLHGAHFTPDTSVYLTILRPQESDGDTMVSVEKIEVRSDADGRFWLWLTISDAYDNGQYYRINYSENKDQVIKQFNTFLLFSIAGVTEYWEPCPGTYASGLRLGGSAYVNPVLPTANNVRSEPNLGAVIVGQVASGSEVYIYGGPACSEGWVWWYIESADGTVSGWTSEGDEVDYWLVSGLG